MRLLGLWPRRWTASCLHVGTSRRTPWCRRRHTTAAWEGSGSCRSRSCCFQDHGRIAARAVRQRVECQPRALKVNGACPYLRELHAVYYPLVLDVLDAVVFQAGFHVAQAVRLQGEEESAHLAQRQGCDLPPHLEGHVVRLGIDHSGAWLRIALDQVHSNVVIEEPAPARASFTAVACSGSTCTQPHQQPSNSKAEGRFITSKPSTSR
jgi:hypothetical protein